MCQSRKIKKAVADAAEACRSTYAAQVSEYQTRNAVGSDVISQTSPSARGYPGRLTILRMAEYVPSPLLLNQILLKHNQIIRMRRIPPDTNDIEPEGDGEVDELLVLVIHALAADVFVAVVLGPCLPPSCNCRPTPWRGAARG